MTKDITPYVDKLLDEGGTYYRESIRATQELGRNITASTLQRAVQAQPERYQAAVADGRLKTGRVAVRKYSDDGLAELEPLQKVLKGDLFQIDAAKELDVHPLTISSWVKRLKKRQAKEQGTPDTNGLTPIPANALVPLIDRVSAGRGREAVDPFLSGGNTEAERYYTPVPHGKHTFALEVDGPSMQNPDGKPSFDEGDIIFVDPDKAINSGDLVVARLGLDQEVTFKQYKESDGQKYLWALNPTWTPRKITLDENTVIVGAVLPGKFVR